MISCLWYSGLLLVNWGIPLRSNIIINTQSLRECSTCQCARRSQWPCGLSSWCRGPYPCWTPWGRRRFCLLTFRGCRRRWCGGSWLWSWRLRLLRVRKPYPRIRRYLWEPCMGRVVWLLLTWCHCPCDGSIQGWLQCLQCSCTRPWFPSCWGRPPGCLPSSCCPFPSSSSTIYFTFGHNLNHKNNSLIILSEQFLSSQTRDPPQGPWISFWEVGVVSVRLRTKNNCTFQSFIVWFIYHFLNNYASVLILLINMEKGNFPVPQSHKTF